MTAEQTKLIQQGFGHMVDNGYSQLDSIDEVIKVLEVSLERARRQQKISKMWSETNPGADAIVAFLEPTIRNLQMRTPRGEVNDDVERDGDGWPL